MPSVDPKLKNLRKASEAIFASQTPEKKLQALTEAFELFSQESSRLENAYTSLKDQFQHVNKELSESNKKLNEKIFEFHIMMNYLTSILNHMSQGILFIGLSGMVTTYNTAAEKMLGKPKHDILYTPFWENFPDELFGFSVRAALTKNQAPVRTYITLRNEQLSELEINSSFVLADEQNNIQEDSPYNFNKGMIILIRDITEIRRLELIANRNDRMKELGEMAAMVAHEIRNPLGGIKGFASLLVRDLEDSPNLKQMAQYIVDGTDSLNRLVTDVLNYSRPIQMKFENLDLVKEINEVVQHVLIDSSLIKNNSLVFETRLPALEANIDSQLFKSVILNMIVNAIQAMPNGGHINIELSQKDKEAIIMVKDTGEGIQAENLPKVFSPFFTTKPTGHGFGLAEAFKIIQGHRGNIEVKSKVGQGTNFTIIIPLT